MYVFFSLNTAVTFSPLSLAANLEYWLKLYWAPIIKSVLKVHVYIAANEYFILMYTVFWKHIVFTEGKSVVNVCDKVAVSVLPSFAYLVAIRDRDFPQQNRQFRNISSF